MPAATKSLNVLFIGNSFTARNNLPGLIADMAKSRDLRLNHHLINVGGASLRMHFNRGNAQALMQRERFDYVVLQEQSTLPIKNAARMRENVLLFDPAIRAAGAKPMLYMTWARQHVPETQRQITDAYESIGREIKATVVPVGLAWQKVLAMPEHPVLHDKDKSHPTLAGSYLGACVFFGVLFGQDPLGLPAVEGISATDAKLLQQAAGSVPGRR